MKHPTPPHEPRTRTQRMRRLAPLALLAALTSGCGMIVDLGRSHDEHSAWEPVQPTEVASKEVQSVAAAACREALEHKGAHPRVEGAEYTVADLEFEEDFHRHEMVTYGQKFTGNLFWPDYEDTRTPVATAQPGWVAAATYTIQPAGTPARGRMDPTTRTQNCLYQPTDADQPTGAQWGPLMGPVPPAVE